MGLGMEYTTNLAYAVGNYSPLDIFIRSEFGEEKLGQEWEEIREILAKEHPDIDMPSWDELGERHKRRVEGEAICFLEDFYPRSLELLREMLNDWHPDVIKSAIRDSKIERRLWFIYNFAIDGLWREMKSSESASESISE